MNGTDDTVSLGPIPARAGEPVVETPKQCEGRAYPRSRGGTFRKGDGSEGVKGLSPLARGNLRSSLQKKAASGPIPARAGEPH